MNKAEKAEYMRTYYVSNRKTIRERQRAYYRRNPDAYLTRNRKWRQQHPAHCREVDLRKRGWTRGRLADAMAAQNNRCAICAIDLLALKSALVHVDHDHATKQPRGVLCQSCNLGLGHFADSPGRLESAANYLRKWRY